MGNAILRIISKKRTATESSHDEQKNEDSDALQQAGSAKRRKIDSPSDQTSGVIQATPNHLVATPLLATNIYRIALQRALNAKKTIRLETLHHSLIKCFVISVTTLKDEVLLFCLYLDKKKGFINEIRVYDRNNMAEVKEIIPFTKIRPAYVAACSVSNCIYVLEQHRDTFCSSVFRFTRDETQKWKIQTWISDLPFSVSFMSVSPKGNLIIREEAIKIYGPNGFLHREITGLGYVESVIQKSNGNLIGLAYSDQDHMELKEIDTNEAIVRRYISSLGGKSGVNFADISGRILINNPRNGIELLDSEFNLLDYTGPQPNQNGFNVLNRVHYNSERNEVASVYSTRDEPNICALAIFRFTEK